MSFDPEKVRRVDYDEIDGEYECMNGAYVSSSDYDQLLALYREAVSSLKPAVVTSDGGVVEGIFTSWDAAFAWANLHNMNESNIRGGVPFLDVQFPPKQQ